MHEVGAVLDRLGHVEVADEGISGVDHRVPIAPDEIQHAARQAVEDAGVAGYDVVLTEIAANVDELAVTGKANLAGLLTSQPTFSITFAAPSIDLRSLFTRIPAQWIHAQLPAIIEQRQLGGTVEILSATLTGATAPSPQLSLTGDFRIEKGMALIGNDRVPTQNLAATVSVEPGRIRVGKVTGAYGSLQITDGKALVSFLDDGPWMELDVSGDMSAADLVKFLTKTIRADKLTSLLAQRRALGAVGAQVDGRIEHGLLAHPHAVLDHGIHRAAHRAMGAHGAAPMP